MKLLITDADSGIAIYGTDLLDTLVAERNAYAVCVDVNELDIHVLCEYPDETKEWGWWLAGDLIEPLAKDGLKVVSFRPNPRGTP